MEPRALVLLALVAGATAGPLNSRSEQCALTCKDSTKLKYEPGQTYEFSYEADTVTTLKGASQEHSSLHIRATADVSVLAPCEHLLTLRDVQLEESDPTDLSRRMPSEQQVLFQEEMEMRPLRFSFQDGRVEALCTSGEEPHWVLNVKRGVLSAFQNSMEQLERDHTTTESDVSGNCEAEYEITARGWNSVTVKKSKNLLACTDRAHQITAFQTTPYRVPSEVQSLPLLSSSHECEQTLQPGGAVQKTECHESHVFRPFSGRDSGATTTSHHLLQFQRETSMTSRLSGDWSRRTSLVFEHKPVGSGRQGRDQAEATLRQICEAKDVRPETPRLFSELVERMRELDPENIHDLHRAVSGERVCSTNHIAAKKFFHDAVPMVGSAASVALIRDLVMKGRVTGNEADAWFASLAFISKPDADTMREVKPLMEMSPPKRSLLLSVSALVHAYCQTDATCAADTHVQDMARRLVDNLGHHCKVTTPAENEQVVLSLKALGNMGAASGAEAVLSRCVSDTENPVEIRLAAMDAFRRMDCDQSREALLRLFENAEEDSELRIGAYLAAMQCPGRDVIARVRSVLEGEQVNQVGSFVWTHLTNLAESADPFRKDVKNILQDTELGKTFNLDERKFSRNYEGSLFFPSINMGAKSEGNLVWSSNSYIPRSANLNLTVDLFGQSVNLLEVGGRVEGLETLMESLFGPDGYFPENTVSSALKRQRRAANDKLASLNQRYNAKREDRPHGSGYLRMFGNELGYQEFEGLSLKGAKDKLNFMDLLLTLARDNKLEFSKSARFLDSTLCVPTVSGLPLRLALDGSASVDVLVTGKVDLRQVATAPRSLHIGGTVRPSGSVEISSTMTVDAFVSRSGLKMVTTLHSSTELTGQVSLQDSEVITASLDMPRDKLEVLDVQSKFFVIHRNTERPQLGAGSVEKSWCSGEQVQRVLGVELCAELQYTTASQTAPAFPLSGPAGITITLHKRDSHTAYEFEGRMQTKKEHRAEGASIAHVGRLSFNTPGSQVDRQFLVDLTLDQARKTLDANFRSPWKKVTASGEITLDENAKRLSARATVDDRKQYSLTSDLQITKVKGAYTVSPSIEVSVHGWDVMSLTGALRCDPEQMVDVDLTLDNVLRQPATLKAIMEKEEDKKRSRYTANVRLGSHLFNVGYKGFVEDRRGIMRTRMTLTHDFRVNKPYTYTLVANGKQVDNKKLFKYSVHADMDNDQFPALNMLADASVSSKDGHVDSSLDLRYGGNLKDENRRLTLNTEANWEGKLSAFQADYSVDVTVPALNIDMASKMNHRHTPSDIKTQAMVRYQRGKKVNFDMNLRKESTDPLKLGADISLTYPGRELSLSESLEETQPNTYNHELTLKWRKNQEFKTVGVYKRGPGNMHDLTVEIIPPGQAASTLTASTSLKLDDFQAKVKVDHRRDTYATSLVYNYNLPKEVHGSVEVEVPSRHVTAAIDMSKQGRDYTGRLETRWDADQDPSKKLIVDGRLQADPNKKEGHVKMIITKRKLSAAFTQEKNGNDYSSSAEVSWAPKKSVSISTTLTFQKERAQTEGRGKIILTTPFDNFENLQLDGEFNGNRKQHAANAAFTWAEGQTIRTTVARRMKAGDWSDMESSITVDTPFQKFRKMVGVFNYGIDGDQANSHIEAMWDEDKVEVDIFGKHQADSRARNIEGTAEVKTTLKKIRNFGLRLSHNIDNTQVLSNIEGKWKNQKIALNIKGENTGSGRNRKLEGSVSLRTPFEMISEVSLTGSHRDDNQQYITSMEASWSPSDKMSLYLDVVNEGMGWYINNHGQAQITTPFNAFRQASATWLQQIQGDSLKTNNEVHLNDKRYLLNFEGSHQTYAGRQLSGKFQLQTPHSPVEDVEFVGEYTRNLDSVTSKVTFKKDEREQFYMSSDMKTENDADYDGKIEIKLMDHHPITANVFVKTSRKPLTSHVEVSWANNKRVSLDGELTTRGIDLLKGTLRLTTPLNSPFERLVLNVDHAHVAEEWKSHADFEYNAGNVEIDTVFSFGDEKKATVAVRSPWSSFKSFDIDMEHGGTSRRFQNKASLNFENEDSKVSYDSVLTFNTIRDVSGQFTFTSPFENFKNLEMNLRNKRKGNGEWVSTADFQYRPRQKIEVETRMMNAGTISASINVATPFRALKKLSTGFEHVGASSSFDNKVSFTVISAGEKRDLSTALTVRGPGSVNGQLMYSCPHHDINVNLNHAFDGETLTNRADITADGKKMEWEASVQTRGDIKADVSLKTPFPALSSILASMSHSGNFPDITSRGSLDMESYSQATKLGGELQMSGRSFFNGRITLTSPYKFLENIEVTAEHRDSQGRWTTSGAVTYAKNKVVSLTSKVNPSNPAITLVFKSPFEGFEKIMVSGSHENAQGTMTTHAELRYSPGQKFTLDSKVMIGLEPKINVEIRTPLQNLKYIILNFEHTGQLSNFHTVAEVDYEPWNGKMSTDLSFTTQRGNLDASLTITSPFIDAIKATLDHKMKGRNFVSKAILDFGKTIELNSRLNLQSLSDADGEITFTSPYPVARNLQTSFNHKGSLNSFNSHLEGKYNRHRATMDAAFSAINNIRGNFKLETTHQALEIIELLFSHEGQRDAFHNHAELTYTTGKKIELDSSLNLRSGIEGKVETSAPFYEPVSLSVSHQGELTNFQHTTELGYGRGDKISLRGNLQADRTVEGDVTLTTPFNVARKVAARISHRGKLRNFQCSGNFALNGKEAEIKASLDSRGPIAAKFQLSSPIKHLEDVSLNFDYSGNLPQFTTKLVVNYAPGKTILVEESLSVDPSIQARFHLNTPCAVVEDILFNFEHEGTITNFRNNANLSFNSGSIVEFSGEFNTDRTAEGGLTLRGTSRLQTPYDGLRDVSYNLRHELRGQGDWKSFVELSSDYVGNVRFNGDVQLSPKVSGDFHLETPFNHIKDVVLKISHKGTMKRFKDSLEFSSDDVKSVEFESDFKYASEITGSVSLRTPFKIAKRMSAAFTHTGHLSDFNCHGEVFHNMMGNVQGDASFRVDPDIGGSFSLQTPMEYAKETSLSFTHSGKWNRFRHQAEFSNNYLGQYGYEGQLGIRPEINGNFKLNTPITNMKGLAVAFSHRGSLAEFASHVEADSVEHGKTSFDADFRVEPSVTGTFNIETPIQGKENMRLTFKHNGNMQNFQSEAELNYFGGNTIRTSGNLRLKPSIDGTFNLQTPFKKLRDVTFSAKHDGHLKEFSTQAQIHSGQKTLISIETEFKTTPTLDGVFKLQSSCPVVRDIFVHFNHEGELLDFKTLAEASMNREKTIRGTVEFKTSPTIQGSAKLETPFEEMRQMEASFNHRGSLQRFQSEGQFHFNGRPMVTYDAKFRPAQSYLKMKTPITNFERVTVAYNHRGDMSSFQTHAEAEVNNQKIEGDVEFSLPLSGKVTIKTPFDKFEEQSAAFTHAYNVEGFQTHGEVKYFKGTATVDADMKYWPIEMKVQMSSPYRQFRDIVLSLNHKHNKKNLQSNAEFHLNGEKKFLMEADMRNYARKTGNFKIQTPFTNFEDMSLEFRHSGDTSGFKSKGEVSYAPGKTVSGDVEMKLGPKASGQIVVRTPFSGFEDVSVDFSHDQDRNAINSMGRVTYGGKQIQGAANLARSARSVDGSIQLTTPFKHLKDVGIEVHHQGDLADMQGKVSVKYAPGKTIEVDGTYKPAQLALNLRTPFQHAEEMSLELKGSHQAPRGSFSWAPNKKVSIDGSLRHSGGWWEKVLEGNLEVRTPFQKMHHLSMSGQHQHSSSSVRSSWKAGFNNNQVFDMDVNYNAGDSKSGEVTLRLPRSARAEFDMNTKGGSASLNWDTTRDDSNVRVEVTTNDESTRYRTKRDVVLKTITPSRTMIFTTALDKSARSFSHKSELCWNDQADKKISYELDFKDQSRRSKNSYELSGRLDTPVRSVAMQASHTDDGATYTSDVSALWDAARDQDRKLTLTNVYKVNGNQHRNEFTISHPRMTKDIVVRHEVILNDNNVLYSGRTELEYSSNSRENLVMSTRLEDTSSGQGQNYTLALGLSHPQSDLDMEMTSHLANSPEAMSAGMDISYLNSRRQNNNMHLRGEIEKLKQQLSMELATPMKTISVNGKAKDAGDLLSLNLVATSDDTQQLSAKLDLDTEKQTLDMSAHYSPDNAENVLQVRGKYLSPTEIKLEATRHHEGRDVTEASIDVDLRERHLLHSALYWRPAMLEDIQGSAENLVALGQRGATSTWKDVSEAASKELRNRQRYLAANTPDVTPLMTYLREEVDSLQRDLAVVSREADRMYNRNEFFMQDLVGVYRQAVNAISEQLEKLSVVYEKVVAAVSYKWSLMIARTHLLIHHVQGKYEELRALGEALATRLRWCMEQRAQWLADNVGKSLQDYAFRFAAWVGPYAEEYIRYYNHATMWLSKTSTQMQDTAQVYYDQVKAHPVTQKLNDYYVQTADKVNSAVTAMGRINLMKNARDLHLDLDDQVKAVTDKLAEHAATTTRTVNRAITLAHDVITRKMDDLMSHEKSQYVKEMVAKAYNKAKWAYETYEVERLVKQAVREGLTASVRLVKKNAYYMLDDYLHLDDTKIIRYRPKLGMLEFQVYLPMEWPTLQTVPMPLEKLRALYAKVKDVVELVPDYSVWDTVYSYKPTSDIRDWIPPFKAHAAVVGRQHYLTFDGRFYEFAGECSYVLAADFIDGDFSVVANYDGTGASSTRKSLTVTLEGKEIDITPTGVTVDGSSVDLPLTVSDGSVRREGSHVVVQSSRGLLVDCDLPRDACSVQLSGWYYGKTAGLLGNYNNEPADDLTTADRVKTEDVQRFARSWEVGRCRSHRNEAVTHSSSLNTPATSSCSKLFHARDSPLRPCFKQVDPEPYMKMCVNEAEEDIRGLGVEHVTCKMAAVYVAHCRRIEVHIRVPPTCVRCERPGSSPYTEGQETRLNAAPMSADVVFVVQEAACNRDMQRHLQALAVNMELNALNTIGLKENRFGLVGFGGGRQHGTAHAHTLGGQLLADARSFKAAVKGLDLDTEETDDGEVESALRLAVAYPYRAGVSRTIILVGCGPCAEGDSAEVKSLLTDRHVTLHILTEQDFTMAGDVNTPKSNKLFGIDHQTAFLANHVSDQKLVGDPVLFGHIVPPTDKCSVMSRQSGGAVFNSAKLTQGRVNVQKRFLDILQRRVAQSAVPAACQRCRCVADDLGVGTSVCTPC